MEDRHAQDQFTGTNLAGESRSAMGCSKRQIGQWMFQVNHVAELERQADWLLSFFEKMHNEGTVFFPGMKVELGWSMFELRNDGMSTLVVYEPDF